MTIHRRISLRSYSERSEIAWFGLVVVSYGLESSYLSSLPSADVIKEMTDEQFDDIANNIMLSQIASGKGRETLDWEHIRDLRGQSEEFNSLFEWIAHCLEKKTPYSYEDYTQIAKVEGRYNQRNR